MKAQIFLTGLAIVALTTFAGAENPGTGRRNGHGNCNGTDKCSAFVDANKNGICDTYENRTTTASGSKGNGTGNCTGTGQGQKQGKGKGKNFVDANLNGICDTFEAFQKK
ncbi:MAG TPA: hypothetical protein DCR40_01530 [Prolixibacteraceae bacterium]|nr:hypothetical protein [Prolixibacteraceae bacterium]